MQKCIVCGKNLIGKYAVNFWNNKFCVEHLGDRRYSRCYSCGRIICSGITGGGVRYYDNRTVCNICRKTAIDDTRTTQQIASEVMVKMKGWGLDFSKGKYLIRLVNEFEITEKQINQLKPPCGQTRTKSYSRNGVVFKNEVTEIMILYGLPYEFVAAIMAHEFCHVYIAENKFPALKSKIEEGLCEFSEYYWLSKRNGDLVKYRRMTIEKNPDPIYGDGFRLIRKLAKQLSFIEILEHIKLKGTLPIINVH